MLRSAFSATKLCIDDDFDAHTIACVMAITDLNEAGKMSVTNDIENVLSTLRDAGRLRPGMLVIYRDSEGVWDQVVIDKRCAFVGFHSLGGELDRDAAVAKVVPKVRRLKIAWSRRMH